MREMTQYIVPRWNLSCLGQEQVDGEEGNRLCHVHSLLNNNTASSIMFAPMSRNEVAELTWENGQLAMHGLGGLLQPAPTKYPSARTNDTLESIVNQVSFPKQSPNFLQHCSLNSCSPGKWMAGSSVQEAMTVPPPVKKQALSDSEYAPRNISSGTSMQAEHADLSTCASGSAAFCRDKETTLVTWASLESPKSFTTKNTDEFSACQGGWENQREEQENKGENGSSHKARRSRCATIHNQSERRRRDRINQKMKALQRLVPNANKTDKASMLDEVIEYLKHLQAQVQLLSRNMPHMMMQNHLQMSLLARMGMGVGLGMGVGVLEMARTAPSQALGHPAMVAGTAAPTFLPHQFLVPSVASTQGPQLAKPELSGTPIASVPLPDPLCAYLAQSMNMELYNKLSALYCHPVNQTDNSSSNPSLPPNQLQRN